jgi:hypothetical protein
MHVRSRVLAGIVVPVMAAAMLVTGALSAQAATRADLNAPESCGPPGYLTTQSARYVGNPATREYGQAGGTLSISRGTTKTISGTLQTTVSADAGVIFASVSTTVGISVGLSKSVTTTAGYTWQVPSSQSVGWVEMGSHGYQISWRYGSYNSSCGFVTSRSGSLSGVTNNVQFAHS